MVNHGMSIDARHVMLLADLMTFKVAILLAIAFFNALLYNSWLIGFSQHHQVLPFQVVSSCCVLGRGAYDSSCSPVCSTVVAAVLIVVDSCAQVGALSVANVVVQ